MKAAGRMIRDMEVGMSTFLMVIHMKVSISMAKCGGKVGIYGRVAKCMKDNGSKAIRMGMACGME